MNKYTKAMPVVRASKLYKSLCRVFRKQDHKELLRQLVWAYVDYSGPRSEFALDDGRVDWAFAWERTPQGVGFWFKVDAATYSAGR